MKPVFQTIRGDRGNCFAACVASILEVQIKDLPPQPRGVKRWWPMWWKRLERWLWRRGLDISYFQFHRPAKPSGLPACICIAKGSGGRGFKHAVVYVGRKMVHDPCPVTKTPGLKGKIEGVYLITVGHEWKHGNTRKK